MSRSLQQWLTHTEQLHTQAIDMGLERVQAVRQDMGLNPKFSIITVAGTNGKGSTCTFLFSMLKAAGYRVGVYSSPHLVRYNERVRIGDQMASDEQLCAAFARVEQARTGRALTPFEFGTLAAMSVFTEAKVDVAVLEVGLGGRLDAVNIFDPDCAVVTGIAIDHESWLGSTREAIGSEKAGVFRAQRPAICGDPNPPACIARIAQEKGAQLWQMGQDFSFHREQNHWSFRFGSEAIESLPAPGLYGQFQYCNASSALAALMALRQRLPVSFEAISRGLRTAALPGRFQICQFNQHEVILDVAHNPQAAEMLFNNLAQRPTIGRTLAVFGMLKDKDIASVVRLINPQVDVWYLAPIEEKRGAHLEDLHQALAQSRGELKDCHSVAEAFTRACQEAQPQDRILVFGSFVTVGAVLGLLPTH
jgi:dihydrofolate synthase/folylpolyglutamate synthase